MLAVALHLWQNCDFINEYQSIPLSNLYPKREISSNYENFEIKFHKICQHLLVHRIRENSLHCLPKVGNFFVCEWNLMKLF